MRHVQTAWAIVGSDVAQYCSLSESPEASWSKFVSEDDYDAENGETEVDGIGFLKAKGFRAVLVTIRWEDER